VDRLSVNKGENILTKDDITDQNRWQDKVSNEFCLLEKLIQSYIENSDKINLRNANLIKATRDQYKTENNDKDKDYSDRLELLRKTHSDEKKSLESKLSKIQLQDKVFREREIQRVKNESDVRINDLQEKHDVAVSVLEKHVQDLKASMLRNSEDNNKYMDRKIKSVS